MNDAEIAAFIYQHTIPQMVDVETAKRALLEFMSQQGTQHVGTQELITAVRQKMGFDRGPIPEGYTEISPDLNETKAKLAAFEAIQLLAASGVLVGSGQIAYYNERQSFGVTSPRYMGAAPGNPSVWIPAAYAFYGLSTTFRNSSFRLADGDVYLSTLDQTHLTSRAKRCLQEAINAFKHGLYLSTTLNAGAASESLWTELGHLVDTNTPSSRRLTDELNRPYPSIGVIIDETWSALVSHADVQLRSVFANATERTLFKDHADRLRNRRNYAIHSDDADLDEPLFTYNETGHLLLDSADYFNKLVRLIAAMT